MAAAERRILTLAIVLASAMVAQAFGRFTWGVVLPDARDDLLDGSNTAAGLFGSLNVGAYLLGTIVVAWLASRSSLVGLVKVGLVLSTSGLALASFTTRPAALAMALVIMGLGGAIIWVPVPGIAARQFPPERRGFATGIAGVGIGVGIVFAGRMAAFLRGGKMLHYGAKSIPEGGLYSMPKNYGDGFLIAGDSSGFMNSMRLCRSLRTGSRITTSIGVYSVKLRQPMVKLPMNSNNPQRNKKNSPF